MWVNWEAVDQATDQFAIECVSLLLLKIATFLAARVYYRKVTMFYQVSWKFNYWCAVSVL